VSYYVQVECTYTAQIIRFKGNSRKLSNSCKLSNSAQFIPCYWSTKGIAKVMGSEVSIYVYSLRHLSVLVAARSKAYECGRSPAGIAGSNSTGGMDVCLL
jgi:hypothetical protein